MTNYACLCQTYGWTEEQIIQYDEIALEDHSHVATRPSLQKMWRERGGDRDC